MAAVLGVLLVLATIGPTAAEGAAAGPRLAFARWSLEPYALEIVGSDPLGGAAQTIVGRHAYGSPMPYPFMGPAWSPDGSRLAFTGLSGPVSKPGAIAPSRIFLVAAEGGPISPVAGTDGGFAPVFSPDGRWLAFTRQRERRREGRKGREEVVYESAAVWLLDLQSGESRQLTPWRNHLFSAASSFSPDGQRLAISRVTKTGRQAVSLDLSGGEPTILVGDGFEPRYSPDGSRIVFARGRSRVFRERRRQGDAILETKTRAFVADLFMMRADGSRVHRLTRTPNLTESDASWDPSGSRLAYLQAEAGTEAAVFGFGNAIAEMNPDGSCQTVIISDPGLAFFGPVWQPGPARAVGRIEC